MRHWGGVLLVFASALVGPIATAAPAHAACIVWFGCNNTPTTTVDPTPTTAPPVTAPPAPAPAAPASVTLDPDAAATGFFDDVNAARADAGLPPLAWRADVAVRAVAHSADIASQGAIFHGDWVSDATLKSFDAHEVGENVGMGDTVDDLHAAFM